MSPPDQPPAGTPGQAGKRAEGEPSRPVATAACGGCILFTLVCCVVGGAVVGRWLLDRAAALLP